MGQIITNSSLDIARIENDHCGSNAYIITAASHESAAIIDPGDVNSRKISEYLSARGLKNVLIVLTHEHFDHMSGVSALRECFNAKLVASRECSHRISDPRRNLSRYTIGVDIDCAPADVTCDEIGSELVWEHLRLEFVPAPGHSVGSICIALEKNLFTGDTIVPAFPTISKLPGGDREALQATIESIYKRFPQDTLVYPGHGDPCRLSDINQSGILGKKCNLHDN